MAFLSYYIHLIELLPLMYLTEEFLSIQVAAILCCRVLWNLPEAFRVNSQGSSLLQVNAPPLAVTANQILSLRCQH